VMNIENTHPGGKDVMKRKRALSNRKQRERELIDKSYEIEANLADPEHDFLSEALRLFSPSARDKGRLLYHAVDDHQRELLTDGQMLGLLRLCGFPGVDRAGYDGWPEDARWLCDAFAAKRRQEIRDALAEA
jgi:hypothetical protein